MPPNDRRSGGQPRASKQTNDQRNNLTQTAPGVNSAFQIEIRAAVAAELAPVLQLLEDAIGQRQSDVVDTSGLCAHFDFSPPIAKKLVEAGCPHFKIGDLRRWKISDVEKWLASRGQP